MIVVRPYRESDAAAVKMLHVEQNLGYLAPDWSKMLVSGVVEVEGRIQMAGFLRKTAETYLLLDPKEAISKRERLGQLLILHRELNEAAKREALTDVHCWLPPSLEKFGTLLQNPLFGWMPAPWPTCYSREVR